MTTLAAPRPDTLVDLPAPRRWVITWEGQRFTEQDVTGEHLAYIALLTGVDSWEHIALDELDPSIGPLRLMWLITAFVAVRDEIIDSEPLGELIQSTRALSAEQLLDCLTFE